MEAAQNRMPKQGLLHADDGDDDDDETKNTLISDKFLSTFGYLKVCYCTVNILKLFPLPELSLNTQ